MKKKRIYYLIVLILIAAILAAGVLLSDITGRWFGSGAKNALARVNQVEGDVSILRDGMAYVLKKNVSLRQDDSVVTGTNAGCETTIDEDTLLCMDGDSTVTMQTLSRDCFEVAVEEGAVLFSADSRADGPTVSVCSKDVRVTLAPSSVLAVETYHGSVTVSVFGGMPVLACSQREYTLLPGDRVTVLDTDELQPATVTFNRVMSADLREFFIRQLIERGGLLFETAQLQAVLDSRRMETETIASVSEHEGLICTLEIRCDTVLGFLDSLPPEKASAVPADGSVLAPVTVAFSEGDTAFDVLRRACLSAGIEIDCSYTVNLSGYYIKTLAGLSEYDLGPESGWMYKVNGWFPNYGSSRYNLSDGDVIVWCYSCSGLGADLGSVPWQSARDGPN